MHIPALNVFLLNLFLPYPPPDLPEGIDKAAHRVGRSLSWQAKPCARKFPLPRPQLLEPPILNPESRCQGQANRTQRAPHPLSLAHRQGVLSRKFLRNFLPVGKDFTIPAADYLPVGNGAVRLGGEGDKTSVSSPTPDTRVVWPSIENAPNSRLRPHHYSPVGAFPIET
jgi:hypothetical protein